MITDRKIIDFVSKKPWEQLLYYRLVEFLTLHKLYADEDASKEDFEKQVIDWRNLIPEWQRENILKKLNRKVVKVLKKHNII
jgi:hypothetical protein